MKTKIILSLITIIFLSSCANKFSLTKRKYTKGYYFASSKNNSSAISDVDKKNIVVKNLQAKKNNLEVEPISNPEINTTINSQPLIVAYAQLKANAGKNDVSSNITASAEQKNTIISKTSIKPVVNKTVNGVNSQKKGSGDSDLIIQIILCFLWWFNLIAVYLHDGKSITLNFWITLLLDFTVIGGIIFALLVVLDIVDLK